MAPCGLVEEVAVTRIVAELVATRGLLAEMVAPAGLPVIRSD
jgi:hypothetical protein